MPSVVRDTVNCWVSWNAWNVGLLSFDHSLFDGADVFGVSPLDASFGGPFDDVSARLDRVAITRGRNDNLTTMLAGEATVDLRDPDGLFNPDNAPSTPVLVNLCTNPSFEVNTTGWIASADAGGTVNDFSSSSGWSKFGTRAAHVKCTKDNTATGRSFLIASNPFIAVTAGQAYSLSAYVKTVDPSVPTGVGFNAGYVMFVSWYDAGSAFVANSAFALAADEGADGLRLKIENMVAPAGAVTGQIVIRIDSTSALDVVEFYVDGVQLEQGPVATAYCDGDQPGCTWTGTPHASTSKRSSYLGSPLYGQLEDRLHPVKIVSTYNGVKYPRFYGWVDQFTWQPSGRRGITQLHCVDLFYWLARATPVIASTGPTTTGAAIGKILDAVGATDPAMRDLDVGDTILDFSANLPDSPPGTPVTSTGTGSGLDLIAGLLEAERGSFYVASTGKATYRSRLSRLAKTSSATITDHMNAMAPGVDFSRALSRVTVKRTQSGYSAVAAADAATLSKIGYADVATIDTPYLLTDPQADALAAWILSQVKTPRPPLRDFTIDGRREDALLTQILTRELVDRVTVSATRGGTQGDFHIDNLSEVIDGTGHTATWLLSRASTVNPIVFDLFQFDSAAQFVF